MEDMFALKYRGARFSLGYGACPDLEDRAKIAALLEPERIGVHLSEEFQLHPEQSTDASSSTTRRPSTSTPAEAPPDLPGLTRRSRPARRTLVGPPQAGSLRGSGLIVPQGGTWMTSTVPALGTRTAEGSALQAVLLDMDGTLVDTEGFWWDVELEVFASLGHTLDDSWRHVVVGGPMTRSAGFLIEATGATSPSPSSASCSTTASNSASAAICR